jgi:hypothetical protein
MIREIKSALKDFLKGAIIHDIHMLKIRMRAQRRMKAYAHLKVKP